LQAAAALATPQRQGGGFGPAMMAFPQALSQAGAAKRQREADEMQRELFGMKRTGFEDDRAERARQRAAADQQQQYLQSVIATLPPDQQALARAYPAEFIKTMMPKEPGKPLVAKPGDVILDPRDPSRTLREIPKGRETRNVDTGSEILVIDTQTQEVVQRIPKQVSPDARYRTDNPALVPVDGPSGYGGYNPRSNTITPVGAMPGMPGQAAGAPTMGMPAQGVPPQAAAAPGQPAAPQPFMSAKQADAAKEAAAKEVRQKGQLDRANLVIKKLDDAMGKVGFSTTGLTGSIMGKVAGTPAYDLRRDVDTVIANIGFSELQAMREASPTGGALGQVAVQELNMLQAVLSSLDPNQSQAQLQRQLGAVRTHYTNWRNAVMQSRGEQPQSNGPGAANDDPLGIRRVR
jgi:hypothetical protein